jgi:hypothetical protein
MWPRDPLIVATTYAMAAGAADRMVGSISARTTETRAAGNAARCACWWTSCSFAAR